MWEWVSLWGLLFGIKMDIILSIMKFFSKMFYCCGWYGIFLERSVVSETKYHCDRFSRNERAKTNNRLSDSIWDKVHGRWLYICVNCSFCLQTCLPFEKKNCLYVWEMWSLPVLLPLVWSCIYLFQWNWAIKVQILHYITEPV